MAGVEAGNIKDSIVHERTAFDGYKLASDSPAVNAGKVITDNNGYDLEHDFFGHALTDIPGITAVKPKAAFYMFPKIDTKKFNIVNDEKFALDLLKEKKILLVHGGGFNWHQPDHFRVVYLPRIEVLKEAAGKIRDFLEYYQQEI